MKIENMNIEDAHVASALQSEPVPIRLTKKFSKPIKKIPHGQRHKKINFSLEPIWYKRYRNRLQLDSQFLRSHVQAAFVLLCVWIGIEFSLFVKWGISDGAERFYQRPPGAEGFLPISALMSLKYWAASGIINDIHPASIFILFAIIGVSVVAKKAFCSWMCPIGTLSESLWLLGQKIFKKNFTVWQWLDYPLRSLKYLLLFFFVFSIWNMDIESLRVFIYSPYNKVADIKMYLFFAEISGFALGVIVFLLLISVVIKNFWCRFLCPYGALLGIFGWLSPLKVTRNSSSCIDCELCTKVCPSNIKVHEIKQVWSDECTNCLLCVEECPVKNTLDLHVHSSAKSISPFVMGSVVVGVFVAITGLAMVTGHWHNKISNEEYLKRFQRLDSPLYQHARGQVPEYEPND